MTTTARWMVATSLVGLVGLADASPVVRFGMTTGANRNTPEAAEVGPMFAAGARAGRFTGELNYSYLSFLDPDTSIHRAGVALRADLSIWGTMRHWKTLFGELGVAKRWGAWRLGSDVHASTTTQNEMHVSIGLQLDDKWQFALRVGAARLDPNLMPGIACRGVACAATMLPDSTGLAGSVMLEWLFMLGH
jgi:hypothetical protein